MEKNLQAMTKAIVVPFSPAVKAAKTGRWARILTKCLISGSGKAAVKWRLIEFGGTTGAESRGIVDILAIRKNHKKLTDFKRGDLFDIVVIQTKGGTAARPSIADIVRLRAVANYYHAKAIVLAEWKLGKMPKLYRLDDTAWNLVEPAEIFG